MVLVLGLLLFLSKWADIKTTPINAQMKTNELKSW
jgi:hypothetical protein